MTFAAAPEFQAPKAAVRYEASLVLAAPPVPNGSHPGNEARPLNTVGYNAIGVRAIPLPLTKSALTPNVASYLAQCLR